MRTGVKQIEMPVQGDQIRSDRRSEHMRCKIALGGLLGLLAWGGVGERGAASIVDVNPLHLYIFEDKEK